MKNKKNYDLYLSYGAVCSCSTVLRASSLQFWSYPFDWLGGADVVERAELISNDFEGWLELPDFEFVGTREHPEPKNIFRNFEIFNFTDGFLRFQRGFCLVGVAYGYRMGGNSHSCDI